MWGKEKVGGGFMYPGDLTFLKVRSEKNCEKSEKKVRKTERER